jgi:hypothetical protein
MTVKIASMPLSEAQHRSELRKAVIAATVRYHHRMV